MQDLNFNYIAPKAIRTACYYLFPGKCRLLVDTAIASEAPRQRGPLHLFRPAHSYIPEEKLEH